MLDDRAFRHLLLADIALVTGVVKSHDVAAAIQRYWDRRDSDPVSLADELARIAQIPRQALRPLEAEVAQLIAKAGGDPRLALTRRGGGEPSIQATLLRHGAPLSMLRTQSGSASQLDLRPLPVRRYMDFEVAAQGGMGVIYLAVDTDLSRRVAFKMIRPDSGSTSGAATPATPLEVAPPDPATSAGRTFEALRARFLQEAWVTGGLEHPGVVPVYEMGQTPGGIPYYTMRFVRGDRTFKDALDDVRIDPIEDRLPLLEPFLKVCDTVAYAHSRGVIHRDLKPANVALGQFGEVVLLDWGLAKLEGHEDQAASRWQEKVQVFREAADVQTMGAAGTPGYMSPEAAQGRLAATDARSDVYSLGVMLYEILTGRLPHKFAGYEEYEDRVRNEVPRPARALDASVPEALSDLADRCLAREARDRPADVTELSEAVRSWQAASAIEREVEGHLRDARAALGAAEAATGASRVRQVDRAAASHTMAADRRPEHPGLHALGTRIEALRASGLREVDRARNRRVLIRTGAAAIVLVAVASIVTAVIVDLERRRADRERDAKAAALDDVLRLSDAKVVRDLVTGADDLWPIHPDRAPAMASWLASAGEVCGRRADHEGRRERYRASSPGVDARRAVSDAWMLEVLDGLIPDLDRVEALQPEIERRHSLADSLRKRSIDDRAERWNLTIEAIAASERYDGLRLGPQLGLVPVGPDPDSGLHEFAHLGSGSVPPRDPESERLLLEDDSAVVLVLIPGGTFQMGAQNVDESAPNFDPEASSVEAPVHEVALPAYFLSKYELTQAQWVSLNGEASPSAYPQGARPGGRAITARNPLESVSWNDCMRWLSRWGLSLPSEAQWEYACRAGTSTPWFSGHAPESLEGFANIADEYLHRYRPDDDWEYTPGVNDGHVIHAPVGSFAPNAFGLHDMHGNVGEWCLDMWRYGGPKQPGADPDVKDLEADEHMSRGGDYLYGALHARSAARRPFGADHYLGTLGCRPARALAK